MLNKYLYFEKGEKLHTCRLRNDDSASNWSEIAFCRDKNVQNVKYENSEMWLQTA